jgi:hypothetical protein
MLESASGVGAMDFEGEVGVELEDTGQDRSVEAGTSSCMFHAFV